MYEALKSAKKVAKSIPMESVNKAMLIDGEEIRPVVESVIEELNGGKLHIPNIAPVAMNVWVEFNTPNDKKYEGYNGKLAGLLVYEEKPSTHEYDILEVLSSVSKNIPYNYKWKVTLFPYYMPKNTKNIIPLNGTWVTYLNENGGSIYLKMIADTKKSANIKEGKIEIPGINDDTIKMMKDVVSPLDLVVSTYINCVACFAICTMHTKNVEVKERKGITSIKGRKNEKREYNEFNYHTINVDTFRRKYAGGDSSPKGNREVALHFVRGHFKTYTPEKPLFGKYVGTVWVPDTMRGNKEAGTVNKDYKVIPDKKK